MNYLVNGRPFRTLCIIQFQMRWQSNFLYAIDTGFPSPRICQNIIVMQCQWFRSPFKQEWISLLPAPSLMSNALFLPGVTSGAQPLIVKFRPILLFILRFDFRFSQKAKCVPR